MRGRTLPVLLLIGVAALAVTAVVRFSRRGDLRTPSARFPRAAPGEAAATPAPAPASPDPAPRRGTCIEARTRSPVPLALLRLDGRAVAGADDEGRFTIPRGAKILRAALHACGWWSPAAAIDSREPLTVTIEGLRAVSGHIITGDGRPLPPVTLRATYPTHGVEDLRTPTAGTFRLLVDPSHDQVDLVAEAPGYAPSRILSIPLKKEEDVEGLEIVLTRGGLLKGTVLDDAGRTVEGARIELKPSKTRLLTAPDGGFASPPLAPGTYEVRAGKKGYLDALIDGIAVGEGTSTSPIMLILRKGWSVRGTVSDAQGRPIAGASVKSKEGMQSLGVSTGADGRFDIQGIEPGTAEMNQSPRIDRLQASAKGFGPLTIADVADGADVAMTLLGAATLTLRVRGAEGPLDPELSWTARLLLRRPENVQDRSAAPGHLAHLARGPSITIDGLAPGLYDLEISAPGRSGFRQDGLRLSSGQTTSLDVTLLQGKNETPILEFDASTPDEIRKKLPALLGGFNDTARDELVSVLKGLYVEGSPERAALDEVLLQLFRERK